ncbi:hypothetical protein Snoj_28170 [Streptomyces nojiriensis]|uniref:Uncharacterized protein n=1 Tax=Streptomyces nojiriensis TaxID=66374 RepID=A0ABQ3SLC9_9ACTN|nr:hypothetical protein [Streptomyces nojiriensis]QTI42498.1 hypothetical protein JYK04_00256 [Streptomyces nojiriensis]GGS39612.1 hypothetical protein GCM10010205_81640 [Streptomyces nojiriensis]GHI68899.1 hypothetical protein Snoj_28170 [Streptomyces nojiriensis]
MNNSLAAEHSNDTRQTPTWSPMVVLTGAACAALRFGGVWSWWALLWAPLLAATVGFMIHQWRVLARNHWRMGIIEWLLLTVAHLGCLAAVGLIIGL